MSIEPEITLKQARNGIIKACEELCSLLLSKNESYGNSALDPVRIFSKADAEEQIKVRIDDKISRVLRGNDYPGDDVINDLAGYFTLLKVLRTIRAERGFGGLLEKPPSQADTALFGSIEDARAELRRAGMDPDDVGRRGAAVVAAAQSSEEPTFSPDEG